MWNATSLPLAAYELLAGSHRVTGLVEYATPKDGYLVGPDVAGVGMLHRDRLRHGVGKAQRASGGLLPRLVRLAHARCAHAEWQPEAQPLR